MEIINEEVVRHQKKLAKHYKAIQEIQTACPHPAEHLTVKYGANTGNYDPSEDCYWGDYKCQYCGKSWMGEQEERRDAQVIRD